MHEVVRLQGCVLFDGNADGDGDGLLSDESLTLDLDLLCAVAARCGLTSGHTRFEFEATDCGGNRGLDVRGVKLSLSPRSCKTRYVKL